MYWLGPLGDYLRYYRGEMFMYLFSIYICRSALQADQSRLHFTWTNVWFYSTEISKWFARKDLREVLLEFHFTNHTPITPPPPPSYTHWCHVHVQQRHGSYRPPEHVTAQQQSHIHTCLEKKEKLNRSVEEDETDLTWYKKMKNIKKTVACFLSDHMKEMSELCQLITRSIVSVDLGVFPFFFFF